MVQSLYSYRMFPIKPIYCCTQRTYCRGHGCCGHPSLNEYERASACTTVHVSMVLVYSWYRFRESYVFAMRMRPVPCSAYHTDLIVFSSILDIKFVGRTSRGHTGGRSHRISHPPSFCGACFPFSREEDPIPFPLSTVKSNFVY